MERIVSEVDLWGAPLVEGKEPFKLGWEPDSPAAAPRAASSGLSRTSGICGREVDMGSSSCCCRTLGMGIECGTGVSTTSAASSTSVWGGEAATSGGVATVMLGGSRSGGRCDDGDEAEDAFADRLLTSVSPEEEEEGSVRLLINTHESSTTFGTVEK